MSRLGNLCPKFGENGQKGFTYISYKINQPTYQHCQLFIVVFNVVFKPTWEQYFPKVQQK